MLQFFENIRYRREKHQANLPLERPKYSIAVLLLKSGHARIFLLLLTVKGKLRHAKRCTNSSVADWERVETEKPDHRAFLFTAPISLLLVSEDICWTCSLAVCRSLLAGKVDVLENFRQFVFCSFRSVQLLLNLWGDGKCCGDLRRQGSNKNASSWLSRCYSRMIRFRQHCFCILWLVSWTLFRRLNPEVLAMWTLIFIRFREYKYFTYR